MATVKTFEELGKLLRVKIKRDKERIQSEHELEPIIIDEELLEAFERHQVSHG